MEEAKECDVCDYYYCKCHVDTILAKLQEAEEKVKQKDFEIEFLNKLKSIGVAKEMSREVNALETKLSQYRDMTEAVRELQRKIRQSQNDMQRIVLYSTFLDIPIPTEEVEK